MAIEVNDMFYAYSKDEEIKEKGEYGGAVTTIMKKLLEEGIVNIPMHFTECAANMLTNSDSFLKM